MTEKQYSEVSQETIDQLKLLGFRSLQLILLDHDNPCQAKVEILPLKDPADGLDRVSLWAGGINDFGNWQSPMARYFIDPAFLKMVK